MSLDPTLAAASTYYWRSACVAAEAPVGDALATPQVQRSGSIVRVLKANAIVCSRGAILLLLGTAAIAGILEAKSQGTGAESPQLVDRRKDGGSLVIAGGGCVTAETRERFIELAGGTKARIVVIPATDPPPGEEDQWIAPWRASGASSVELRNAPSRAAANDPEFCAALDRATGVWFSGGYQELLADRYVDTAAQKCLHDLLSRNGVVGGCSAGAAILSRVMIEEGEMRPVEARGLDLISNAIVDQHFLRRNRVWRMQQMLAAHPNLIGLGVDERTALVVEVRTWRLSVTGESYVLVCVPPAESRPFRIEVLKSGDNVLLSWLRRDHLAYRAGG